MIGLQVSSHRRHSLHRLAISITSRHRLLGRPANDHESICIEEGVNNHMLMNYFGSLLAYLARNEEGQTAVEYGLVLALIALVIVAAIATGLGGVVTSVITSITNAI